MAEALKFAQEISTPVHQDARGYFAESWNSQWNLDFDLDVRQTNVCWTDKKYTIRGLHAQYGEAQVAKFVRVIQGHVIDICVDARKDSPNFGQWSFFELKSLNDAVYVPRGYYHGYITLTDNVLVTYHQDAVFDGSRECGLTILETPGLQLLQKLGIDRTILIMNEKDRTQPFWLNAVKF